MRDAFQAACGRFTMEMRGRHQKSSYKFPL